MSSTMTRLVSAALASALLAALLGGCETTQRNPRSEVTVDPGFDAAELVDIAILTPRVDTSDEVYLRQHIREEARKVLIDSKLYAVPSDAFVDQTLSGNPLAPSAAASALGSDAVLAVHIRAWQAGELVPKGRLYASGELALHGPDRVLWRHVFEDRMLLAPGRATSTNRSQVEGEIIRFLVRDSLSTLPKKTRR